MTDDVNLQRLWVSLQKTSWKVLAVVSTTPEGSSLDVANALADVAWQFRGESTIVLDLRDLRLRLVDYQKARIAEHRETHENIVLALASIDGNPASIALARAADAVVLVVRLGETSAKSVERAVAEIGREKIAGAIVAKRKPRPIMTASSAPTIVTPRAEAKT